LEVGGKRLEAKVKEEVKAEVEAKGSEVEG
jgi:hypothetical protein